MIFFCQIFIEPLGQVVGSSTSKFQLLSACKTAEDTNRLQELGCMLGVEEWTNQIQKKCQIMMADMEIVPEEETELIVPDVKEEVKKEDSVVELSTGDEDTQTEPDNDEKQGTSISIQYM